MGPENSSSVDDLFGRGVATAEKMNVEEGARPVAPSSSPSLVQMPSTANRRGFIEQYAELILNHIPTTDDWAESIAIGLLSSGLPQYSIRTKAGKLSLNTYCLAIGPSGLANKTSPLKYFAVPTIRAAEQIAKQKLLLPKSFSIEGLTEYISKYNSKGIIISDEFTQTLKSADGGGYLSQIFEYLSELYDGTIQARYTRTAKFEEATDVYVVILTAASEYIYEVLKPALFLQGIGNRFLYVVFDDLKDQKSPLDFFDPQHTQDLSKGIKKFAEKLVQIWTGGPIEIVVSEEADILLREYRDETLKDAREKYKSAAVGALDHLYMARAAEMCLKLAGIKAISDSYSTIDREQDDGDILFSITMTKEVAEWAISRSRKYVRNFYRLLEIWSRPKAEATKAVKTQEAEKKLVAGIVKLHGTISQTKLLQESGFVKDQKFYSLIGTLVDEGKITKLTEQEVKAIPKADRAKYGIGDFKGQIPAVFEFVRD